jgi:AcrR family transcriptional regulator
MMAASVAPFGAADEWTAFVDAARRVLLREGSPTITIQAILDEASLSTRALYRHFSSKDELVATVVRREARGIETGLLQAIATAPDPAWALHLDPHAADAVAASARRLGHLSRSLLALALEQGVQSGVFAHTEPMADAAAAHAVINDLLSAAADGADHPSVRDVRATMLHFVSRLLGCDLNSRLPQEPR